MAKAAYFLTVISEPASDMRVVFRHGEAVTGTDRSTPDVCCGHCGAILVTGIVLDSFDEVVFLCYACGAFNDTRFP
jgi:hypothetical protein